MNPSYQAGRFGSGQAVQRVEDAALLAGCGQFTANLAAKGDAFVAFLRSPYAHARIASVDVSAARAVPGVLAVWTGAELARAGVKPIPTAAEFGRADGKPLASPPRRALAHEFVRFVGEAVVAVVANSLEAAQDAVEAASIDYEELPTVTDVLGATMPGATALCAEAPDNIAAETRYGDAAATTQAFAGAAHVVSLDLSNQRLAPSTMEPRSVRGVWDPANRRLTMRMSGQMPSSVLNSLCHCIPDLSPKQVRVLIGDVGGGFGMKTHIYPEDIVIAYAALALGCAVRWQAARSEDFLAATHGRGVSSHAQMALDAQGKVLALRVRSLADMGAYPTPTSVLIQLLLGPYISTSIYDIRTVDLHFIAVMTNTAPTGAYRGAGRPEAIYILERLFDAAARAMRLDPAQLRRHNMIRPEQMPYKNAMGQTYDSGRFEQILDQGLALAEWDGYAARRNASRQRGKLRGRGIATFLEWTGGNVFEEQVSVNVLADGIIEIYSATQAMGQGILTCYAQLAVDIFGVPIERIRVLQGDTDRGQGFGSVASRSLFTGGSAVRVAAERTVLRGREHAAALLEAAIEDIAYHEGRYSVAGTDLGIDLFDLAGRQPDARIAVNSTSAVGGPTWPNACHVCEVEIDPDTGRVDIAAYASVNDIGRVVNPAIARGQIDGGAMQGIGQALYEQMVYDPENSQLLTGSFMDYALPHADAAVEFKTVFDTSIPCLMNPLGTKGAGELGTIGATPAVVNAVVDALAHAGLGRDAELVQMPLTSERVWRALASVFVPKMVK